MLYDLDNISVRKCINHKFMKFLLLRYFSSVAKGLCLLYFFSYNVDERIFVQPNFFQFYITVDYLCLFSTFVSKYMLNDSNGKISKWCYVITFLVCVFLCQFCVLLFLGHLFLPHIWFHEHLDNIFVKQTIFCAI